MAKHRLSKLENPDMIVKGNTLFEIFTNGGLINTKIIGNEKN